MHSSTSSSSARPLEALEPASPPGPRAAQPDSRAEAPFRVAAQAFAPTLLAAAVLLGAVELWMRLAPSERIPPSVEAIIVESQLERARAGQPADVLILGDSSALMDVDAAALGQALGGADVVGLGTLGFVGPKGYAAILDRYLDEVRDGAAPRLVVFLINSASLLLTASELEARGFESMVVAGRFQRPLGPVQGAREKLYLDVVAPALNPPLPGRYGQVYGWPDDLARVLDAESGTCTDPSEPLPEAAPGSRRAYTFTLSEGVRDRLPVLRRALARLGPERVRVSITPIPHSKEHDETAAARAAVAAELLAELGLPASSWLELPASLPDPSFATSTHLAPAGKSVYTQALAAALVPALR